MRCTDAGSSNFSAEKREKNRDKLAQTVEIHSVVGKEENFFFFFQSSKSWLLIFALRTIAFFPNLAHAGVDIKKSRVPGDKKSFEIRERSEKLLFYRTMNYNSIIIVVWNLNRFKDVGIWFFIDQIYLEQS